jgi:Domain of unknown function (DUF4276)
MREIALFVEDYAHQEVIGALVTRLASERDLDVRLDWRSARRGHGRVAQELKEYLRDLTRQGGQRPDLIIVATDANCKGLNERIKELQTPDDPPAPMILAVPDPHIERWLLLDGAAFKAVFDKGCDAPDQKCDRDRYKRRLVEAIRDTGVTPNLGGMEFAEDIVKHMDIDRAAAADRSFRRFIEHLLSTFRDWQA